MQEIFDGKESFDDEDLDNLNKTIKSMNLIENQFNEAKALGNKDKITDDENLYEDILIKPIIAFLNSFDGFGNLYLGISTGGQGNPKFLDIRPIEEKFIKNEEYLRNLITNKIGIIPKPYEFPKIEIKKIKFPSGNVFIINVSKTSNSLAYYSKLTNKVYKRSADQSSSLNLVETLQLIESKKNPQVRLKCKFLSVNPDHSIFEKTKEHEYAYELELINEGLEPSELITGLIQISPWPFSEYVPKIEFSSPFISKRDESFPETYQFCYGIPSHSMPVYPIIPTLFGKLTLKIKPSLNFNLNFKITIMDKKGITKQSFSIKEIFEVGISTPNFNPVDEKIEYSPYV